MLISSEPPQLPFEILPEAERTEAQLIETVLYSLRDFTRSFGAAIALRTFCALRKTTREPALADWALMAARDGAAIILHFGGALEDLRALKHTPGLRSLVELSKCNKACRSFVSVFPTFEGTARSYGTADMWRGQPFQLNERAGIRDYFCSSCRSNC
jgi:hypothetical protein